MPDTGKLHTTGPTFGKLMALLIHDTTITDGACRLYAHMHWRYGANRDNHEGQLSMAEFLDVREETISNRVRELEAKDWVVVIERDFNPKTGNWQTHFYHVFEDQQDARSFRQNYQPAEGELIREKTESRDRISRKGVGGNPKLKHRANSSSDGDRPNSSYDGGPNSNSDGDPNLSSDNPDSVDPDSVDPDIKDSPVGAGIEIFKFEDLSSKWEKASKTWTGAEIVYIGKGSGSRRLSASKWANPYKCSENVPPEKVLELYRLHVLTTPDLAAALPELAGKTLVWADEPNHAPVLVALAEAHLNGDLPAMIAEATATVLREQKTVRNNPNRQRIIEAVARHIFKIADPSRIPDGDSSIIGAFEKSIYNVLVSQFGLCNYDVAERSVLRYVEWMKANNRGLPRYVSGFDPDYIAFMQLKDREIRAVLEREGTPATTTPISASGQKPQKHQTLEEYIGNVRVGSPMWKQKKAEWEALQHQQ